MVVITKKIVNSYPFCIFIVASIKLESIIINKMSRDNFLAINLNKIELFFQQLIQNGIRQSTITHFNANYSLALDNLPFSSMYETAQSIEAKAIKHNKYQARQGATIETSQWSLG